jgi:hypothetical protein
MSRWASVWKVVKVIGSIINRFSGESDVAPRGVSQPSKGRGPRHARPKKPKAPAGSTGE